MERLDGSVRRALRGAGVPDAGALAEVTRVWPEVVGDAIARAAWPLRISRDGTLHVAASSSSWAFELNLLGEEILGKLAAAAGTGSPTSIRFAPGPVPAAPARRDAAVQAPPVDEEARRAAERLAAGIEDEELRATIARAAAASLSRAASGRGF